MDMCRRRLQKEYVSYTKSPVKYIRCTPLESDILSWHYTITGPPDSPYEGGTYHGMLKFPTQYPLKPPSVIMYTPSGRFSPGKRLCLSMSDFHPESWNPMWSVSTILTGLFSFMLESSPTFGSIETTTAEKRKLAKDSMAFNVRDKTFCRVFPDLVEKYRLECEACGEVAPTITDEEDNTLWGRITRMDVTMRNAEEIVMLGILVSLIGSFLWAWVKTIL